jgi:HAD superfamily hydrolase (TIGR01490 family)
MSKQLKKLKNKNFKKIAVFDIDGTIFRSSLLVELVKNFMNENIFPSKLKKTYQKAYERWLNRKGTYDEYIETVVEIFNKNIKGVRRKDFLRIGRRIIRFSGSRVYRFTRDLVLKLKKEKYYLVAISYSPRDIVEAFCHELGFNKVYGRMYEYNKNGVFTGGVLYTDLINDKSKILKRFMGKYGFTLRDSVGVGDTESDIPFLKLVKRAICFNPNKKLYEKGKKFGWEIIVERKDVIYHLGNRLVA